MPGPSRASRWSCALCVLIGLLVTAPPPALAQQQTAPANPDDLWANRAKLLPPIAEKLEDAAQEEARKGNLAEAERIFGNALSTREQIDGPDHVDVTITLGKLSVFYWQNGRYADTERMLTRKIAIFEKHFGPEAEILAGELNSLAIVLSAQGRDDETGPVLERALGIQRAQPEPDEIAIAKSLERLGSQQRKTGNHAVAEETYREALAILEARPGADPLAVVSILNGLGLNFQAQKRYDDAEPMLRRALAGTEAHNGADSADTAIQLNNLGTLNFRRGKFAEAAELLARSVAIMEQHLGPDHPSLATQLSNLALARQREGRIPAARVTSARASDIIGNRIRRGHMGRAEIDNTRYIHLRRLAALFDGTPGPDITASTFETSQVANASSAASAVSKLAERYAIGGKADAQWVRIWQDAQVERDRADRELAFHAGQTGAARDQVRIDALAARKNDAQLTVDASNEMLKALYGDDYRDRLRPAPPTVAAIQQILEPDEALLTFTVAKGAGPDEADVVYVVAVSAEGAQAERAVIDDLTGTVAQLRRKLSPETVGGRPGLLTFPTDAAHTLHEKLFAPFAGMLDGIRHVLVVPDGPLTSLPFGILLTAPVDEPPGEVARFAGMPWLIKEFAISVLPSVPALRALRIARAEAAPASQPFIGIGDPLLRNHPGPGGTTRSASIGDWLDGSATGGDVDVAGLFRGNLANTRAVRELASLPETADELTTMANLLGAPGDALLLRDAAIETSVRKERALVDHRILAFATHGLVAGEIHGQGAEPALVLTPPDTASPENDGLLTASEVAEMRLNAQWVILSACNTAGSDGTPGAEGLSGLASAFFYAGAQSLFVSHWPVVSDATVALTTRMLSALAENKDLRASEAHRQSMLAMMEDPDEPMFAHPLFWAPFVVVGDGGVLR